MIDIGMKKRYSVRIKEVLEKYVEVTAGSASEAVHEVTKMYDDCEIVLGGDDYKGKVRIEINKLLGYDE